MLLAHPALLDELVRRYTALERALASGDDDPAILRGREDVVYTLCVSTGTRDIDAALAAARRRLDRRDPGAAGARAALRLPEA